jgi:hypothetical protein
LQEGKAAGEFYVTGAGSIRRSRDKVCVINKRKQIFLKRLAKKEELKWTRKF